MQFAEENSVGTLWVLTRAKQTGAGACRGGMNHPTAAFSCKETLAEKQPRLLRKSFPLFTGYPLNLE